MITFVTAACLLSSWRSRTQQSDPSWWLYLEQCSAERLICRSPNNSNGDGIVCDRCEFVTLYVCERTRDREGVCIYLCQLNRCSYAAWMQWVWIIDKWLCSCSNELALSHKQWDQSTAVKHWSSFSQCQYPAFNSVCIYAYFIKAMFYWCTALVCGLFFLKNNYSTRKHQTHLTHLNVIYWCLTHFPVSTSL